MGVTRSYDYDDISRVDPDTDVTGAELEELTDASETTLHSHAGGGGSGDVVGPASSTDNAIARFDGTTGKTIQNSDVTISDTGDIEAVSTDAGATGPSLSTYHNSASPVADDVVGSLGFYGEDSASNKHQYAKITGVIVDATDGSEDGALLFQISSGSGTLLERLRLSGSNITVTNADIKMGGNKIDLDADNDTSIHADTDDQIDIEIAGADDFRFSANTLTALSGSTIATNTIAETTAGSGVTIDSVLIKDGEVDGVDVSAHEASTAEHGATGAVVGTTNTQTLTNKTIDGASNTISNAAKFFVGTLSSASSPVAISGVGFEPKMVRFFLKGDNALFGWSAQGVSLGTTVHHATAMAVRGDTGVSGTISSATNSLLMTDPNETTLVAGKVTATDSDGFDVTFTTTRSETWVYEAYA